MDPMQDMDHAYQNQVDSSAMFEDRQSGTEGYWAPNGSVDDQGVFLYSEGFESSPGSGNRGRYSSPKYARRSMDDLLISTDARMNRIANAEAAMRQEIYKECTFRPNIKDLPSHYGAKKDLNLPFHARVTKWQKEKEVSLQSKANVLENQKQSSYTYHPKIDKNSDKAVKLIRGNDFNEDVSMRLYKNSEISLQQKELMINEIKMKKSQEEAEECTFKPKLLTKNTPVHQSVQSKFTLPSQPRDDGIPSDLKNCTFTPKVILSFLFIIILLIYCCII